MIATSLGLLLSGTACAASLVGLWEFDDPGNLGKATVGTDLIVKGTAPSYSASSTDGKSTTLNGVISTVQGASNYLDVTHNIGGNGGGLLTNQYTLVYDIKRPSGEEWRAFYQTNLDNSGDAEYFTRGGGGVVNSLGRGTINYSGTPMAENEWLRIAISVDLGNSFTTYVDGALFSTHKPLAANTSDYSLDPNRVLFFADNNGENESLDVGALAIYDGALSSTELAALGGVGDQIPEPSSVALLSLAGLALLRRRSR